MNVKIRLVFGGGGWGRNFIFTSIPTAPISQFTASVNVSYASVLQGDVARQNPGFTVVTSMITHGGVFVKHNQRTKC